MSKAEHHQLILNNTGFVYGAAEPPDFDSDGADPAGGVVLEEERAELAKPPMYQVVMLDDDFTPMEFVVEVLQTFFTMTREQATQIMLTVHTQGRASCGVFSRDIAETKVAQIIKYARENQHPLMCEVERLQ